MGVVVLIFVVVGGIVGHYCWDWSRKLKFLQGIPLLACVAGPFIGLLFSFDRYGQATDNTIMPASLAIGVSLALLAGYEGQNHESRMAVNGAVIFYFLINLACLVLALRPVAQ